MRAASYGRQSKQREDESSGSPIAQQQSTTAFITAREWTFVRHCEDLGLSGYDPKVSRPGLNELLAMVRRREIDVVVVYRLDRFTRQGVVEAVRLVGELAKYGVALASVSEPFLDTTTPMGRGIFALFAAMAEQESYNIQMRTRATKAVIRAAGGFAGGQRPYGLIPQKTVEGKLTLLHLKRHPVEAPILAEVIRRLLEEEGVSVAGEARRLNIEGIKTAADKEWSTSTLIRLLRHPVIAGYSASLRGDIVRDEVTGEPLRPWEGLVDPGVWRELQAKIADRGHGHGQLGAMATLLGGLNIFLCAHCGGRMAGDRRTDGGGTYRCSRHRRGSALCSGAAISMNHLDGYVVSEVFERFTRLDENNADDLDLLRAVAIRYNMTEEDPEVETARANAQAMIDDAMNALNRLDDDRAAGIFDGEANTLRYRRQSVMLAERVEACMARLKALPAPAPADDISMILKMRDEFRQDSTGPSEFFYSGWAAKERRDFITTFLDGILITKGVGRQGGTKVWRGGERVRLVWATSRS